MSESSRTPAEQAESFYNRVLEASRTCALCGNCQKECPVYKARPEEGLAARGKLRLLAARGKGDLDKDTERAIAAAADRCMLCGRCSKGCPNEVPGMETFKAARAFFAETGVSSGILSPRRLLLAKMLPSPALFRTMLAAGHAGKPVLDALLTRFSGLSIRLPLLSGAELLPGISGHSLLKDFPEEIPGPAGSPRVALFSGCVGAWMRPELLKASVRALSRKFTVLVPKDQGCCGLPALSGGFHDAAVQLMERNIRAFYRLKADVIVSPCASCAHTLAHEMEKRVDGTYAEQARTLAPLVQELSVFMAENPELCVAQAPVREPVFVHVPCHLKVGLGHAQAPSEMLAHAGIEIIREGGEQCCGGGALLPQLDPSLSQDVFFRAESAFKQSGSSIVATECSGCFIQWARHLPQAKVAHPVEILYGSSQT